MHKPYDADLLWREALESASEVCKNTLLAEDAACHAFNYVITNMEKWDGRPLRNWVGIIARNKALTLKRELRRFSDYELNEHHLTTETLDEADHLRLQAALRSLKPREVEVIVQHYYNDVELQVIAEQNNESVSAVKVRIMRARNKLKDLL